MSKTRMGLVVAMVACGALAAPAALATEKVVDERFGTSFDTVLDNPCTPPFDGIAGVITFENHTQLWIEDDGSARVSSRGTSGFEGHDADGARYVGRDSSRSTDTSDAADGSWTEKDGSVIRLIGQGDAPNFVVRLNIFRSWSPTSGFRENVVQDSVSCQP
jgi:hypothetical protein